MAISGDTISEQRIYRKTIIGEFLTRWDQSIRDGARNNGSTPEQVYTLLHVPGTLT